MRSRAIRPSRRLLGQVLVNERDGMDDNVQPSTEIVCLSFNGFNETVNMSAQSSANIR